MFDLFSINIALASIVLALVQVLSFLLSAFGALLVAWGGAKAVRRAFWAEAEPWKGAQVPRLEEIRTAFGHRILLGLELFLAGDIIRLLIDPSRDALIRIGAIVLIRVVLSFFITREIRLPVLDLRAAARKR